MPWVGPFRIETLLSRCIDTSQEWPQEDKGVYVVTRVAWVDGPESTDGVLYVGGTLGTSPRFCTRVGDLVADLHGFYGSKTGHHSGGQKLHEWCVKNRVRPGELFLGWRNYVHCARCAEAHEITRLAPLLNRNKAPRCQTAGHARS